MPDTVPFVSVVVPVFNDTRLARCLAALEGQSYPAARYEVVVVDNGSQPPVVLGPARYAHVRLLSEPRPGVGAARAAGLAHATGAIVAFTDADCIPAPTWIERGVQRLLAAPDCGLLGGRIDPIHDGDDRPTTAALLSAAMYLKQDRFVARGGWAALANAFSRREVFEAVGSPRTDFVSSGEIEWAHRVVAAGFRVGYADDVVVRHSSRTSLRSLCQRTVRFEMAWVQLRAQGIGRGPRHWVGQYLVRPVQAIYTDVVRHPGLTRVQKAGVGALASALIGYRLVVYALARVGWRRDTRRYWG